MLRTKTAIPKQREIIMIPTLVIKHWRVVSSFVAMAAFLGWITWQNHQVTSLQEKLAAATVSITSYEESLAALQADSKAKIEALEAETQREIQRTKNKERLLGRIEGASDENNGTVAPVLRDTVERLYGRSPDANQSD